MTALRHPDLNMERLARHILNCAPRSALERSHARAGKPRWYYCGACILIGAGAAVAGLALKAWATLP